MIIINTGLPKSATTLLYDYQIDIINLLSLSNGLESFKRINDGTLFIQSFNKYIYDNLIDTHLHFGNIMVKVHLPPDILLRKLVEEHGALVTCCFRDPRDIILSAIDHGVRSRNGLDKSGAFRDIYTIDDGIRYFKEWSSIYFGWVTCGQAIMIRYEDFVPKQVEALKRINEFLRIELDEKSVIGLYEKHERKKIKKPNFNKGTCYRWKTEMTKDGLQKCNDFLHDEILAMGYSIK